MTSNLPYKLTNKWRDSINADKQENHAPPIAPLKERDLTELILGASHFLFSEQRLIH
ncbi:hypothetical protein [Brunnivagina elsteri]|uniref:hypothetical protein n=1 Tax=Brunnivagina elsteri TaxID=1247191 RepID=UPI001B80B606|nr:hypothetical protein [Calothrix elsteri]